MPREVRRFFYKEAADAMLKALDLGQRRMQIRQVLHRGTGIILMSLILLAETAMVLPHSALQSLRKHATADAPSTFHSMHSANLWSTSALGMSTSSSQISLHC